MGAGYDGHRGWLYAVAVGRQYRRSGVGTALVRKAEAALRELGCNKINLQVRAGNAAVTDFYSRLGYAVEERISMGREI
jgi:ribosomal protein S18 acetylase RimI-like enzyme